MPQETEIETLVRSARENAKYREICPELVTRIATRELKIRKHPREALKETRNALHQIAGAYLSCRPRYDRWLETLDARPRFRKSRRMARNLRPHDAPSRLHSGTPALPRRVLRNAV